MRYCLEEHHTVADRELEGGSKKGKRLKEKIGDAIDRKEAEAA